MKIAILLLMNKIQFKSYKYFLSKLCKQTGAELGEARQAETELG